MTTYGDGFEDGVWLGASCRKAGNEGQTCPCTVQEKTVYVIGIPVSACRCISSTTGAYGCMKEQPCQSCAAGQGQSQSCGGSSGTSDAACVPCTQGSTWSVGNGPCQPCSTTCNPGYYNDHNAGRACTTTQDLQCKNCETGYYCDGNSATRVLCPAGTYSRGETMSSCNDCEAGNFCSGGSSSKQVCVMQPDGANFKICVGCSGAGNTKCTGYIVGCPPGNEFVSGLCHSCQRGYYQDLALSAANENLAAAMTCKLCPPGTYSDTEGATACKSCSPGLYSSTSGQSVCQNCLAGTSNPYTGASACAACAAGYYNDVSDGMVLYCKPCPIGHYSGTTGATACAVAPLGTFVSYTGASTPTACPAGQTCRQAVLTANDLQNCAADTPAVSVFPLATGDGFCGFCPKGQYLNDGTKKCSPCESGFYCLGGGAGRVQCSSFPSAWLGQRYVTRNCSTTDGDMQTDVCLSECKVGEYMAQRNCSMYKNTECSLCETCNVTKKAYNFRKYVETPCTAYANAKCGDCNGTADLKPGGSCNRCPNGTLFDATTGKCELCQAGFFCVATPSPYATASARRLLQQQQQQQQQQQPCSSGQISGEGAGQCVAACPAGQYSADGSAAHCTSVEGPAIKLHASFQYGAMATAVLGLPFPWQNSFLVARVSYPSLAGQVLVLNPDGTTYSLIGNQFLGSSFNNIAVVDGSSVLLNAVQGMGLNGNRLLLVEARRVLVADLVVGPSGHARANVWPPIPSPEPTADYENLCGVEVGPTGADWYVADRGGGGVWSLTLAADMTPAWSRLLTIDNYVPGTGIIGIDAVLTTPMISLLAIDTRGYVTSYSYNTAITSGVAAYRGWQCGGGGLALSTTPALCNEISLAGCVGVSLAPSGMAASDPSQRKVAYLLFAKFVAVVYQNTADERYYAVFAIPIDSGDAAMNFAASPSGFFVTSGLVQGAAVYAMGLHGCLCAAGFYCNDGQCVETPAGTFSYAWSTKPISCPPGTAGNAVRSTSPQQACLNCSFAMNSQGGGSAAASGMTSFEYGSTACMLPCGDGLAYDSINNNCAAACNASLGLYRQEAVYGGNCVMCPYGTAPNGGQGLSSCIPCGAGFFYSEGQCRVCPSNTTTEALASTLCMPSSAGHNDGLVSFNATSSARKLYATPYGLLITTAGSQITLHNLNLNAARLPPSTLNSGMTVDMLQATADGSTLYVASRLQQTAGCITRFDLSSSSDGACLAVAQGDLGKIYSMAVVERPQFNTAIVVASQIMWRGASCYVLNVISLYDNVVRALMHYDATANPEVLWTSCHTQPILVAAQSGTGKLTLAWGGDVYTYDMSGDAREPAMLVQGLGAIVDVSVNAAGDLFLLRSNDIVSVLSTGQLRTVANSSSTMTAITAAGSRLWAASDMGISEIWTAQDSTRCAAGFIFSNDNIGSCMQVGFGHYSSDGLSMQECPAGFHALAAGAATLSTACAKCPAGSISSDRGALTCSQCGSGLVASGDSTACLSTCGWASYMDTAKGGCVACAAGYTTRSADSKSAADCVACPLNTYVNPSTGGQCTACASGYTAPAGAHHCVIDCSSISRSCSSDGSKQCSTVDDRYTMLTQTNLDASVIATTVLSNGGVFFSDRSNIFYYMDDCTPDDLACKRSSSKLLPDDPLMPTTGGRDIRALTIANSATTASTGLKRYLYIAFWNNQTIYRLAVFFPPGDGFADVERTLAAGELTKVAGSARRVNPVILETVDGPADYATFNGVGDMEITQDGNILYTTDIFNYRIRKIDILNNFTVTTVLGTHRSSTGWNYGPADTWGSIGLISGIGLSAPPQQDKLYLVKTQSNGEVGVITDVGSPNAIFQYVCVENAMNLPLLRQAVGVSKRPCDRNGGGLPCLMNNPFDVVATDAKTLYVVYQQGITQIDLNEVDGMAQCLQIAGYANDLSGKVGMQDGKIPLASYYDGMQTPDTPLTTLLDKDSSSLYNPYRLSFAMDKGSLYVGDYSNNAVRRIWVSTPCSCVPGMMLMPGSNTCYNPSPAWSARPLPSCSPGYLSSSVYCCES